MACRNYFTVCHNRLNSQHVEIALPCVVIALPCVAIALPCVAITYITPCPITSQHINSQPHYTSPLVASEKGSHLGGRDGVGFK